MGDTQHSDMRLPGEWIAPSEAEAADLGAKGGLAVEAERLAFEAWMRGHGWSLCATWNGREYRGPDETRGFVSVDAAYTRRIWAAWRDRAALANRGRWVRPDGL